MNRQSALMIAAAALFCAAVALVFVPAHGLGQEKGAAGGGAVSKGDQGPGSDLVNKPAPDFKLEALDGKQVGLADLKGKVLVVDFWGTWCVPCRVAMPHLQELSTNKELAEKGLKVLAINEQDEKPDVQEFVQKLGVTFTVLLDKEGTMAKDYGATDAFPTTVIVGRDGKIKTVLTGYPQDGAKRLDDAVAAAMKEEAPAKK